MKSITQVVENLIKPYIDSHDRVAEAIIAPVETDATSASDDYAVGKQLILNNVLYDVIAPITAGDALVENTNIKAADNVSSDIGTKQPKTLDTPITVGGVQQTTVEGALGSINQTLTNEVSDINTALSNEIATRAKVSGHNLLPNTQHTLTKNGVTFTVNSDGSVTCNGTATALTTVITYESDGTEPFVGKPYILTGCPVGGSNETYQLGTFRSDTVDGSGGSVNEYGEGVEGVWRNNGSGTKAHVYIAIMNGVTVTDLVFRPMLRLATDANPDYEPYSMTNQELTSIAQAVSNRNLLDNPWFTVNQRGQSSYTTSGAYTVDRWKLQTTGSGGSVTINNNKTLTIVRGSGASYIQQTYEKGTLSDFIRPYTVSVLLSDGTIYSKTFTFLNDNSYHEYDLGGGVNFGYNLTDVGKDIFQYLNNTNNSSVTIKAVKLELGSVSTLAMDTAPNYAEELLKCQRYFQRIGAPNDSTYEPLGSGFAKNANLAYIFCPLRTQMRSTPTVTLEGKVYVQDINIGVHAAPCTINASTARGVNALILYLVPDAENQFTSGNAMSGYFNQSAQGTSGSYLDVSADL